MTLSIIIPHGNEPWEVVRPCIDMLNNQKGVDFDDFHVFLVHDGSEPFPRQCIEGPAHIDQLFINKSGVSAARNYGMKFAMECTDSKWINFSDCDDCFSSVFSLHLLMHGLKQENKYDMMWSPFYMIQNGNLTKFDQFNRVFIHNKYYRTSFLKKSGIRFNENIFMSEDSAFNTVILMHLYGTDRIGQINTTDPLYAWCRRPGSITQSPEKWMEITEGHFRRNLYVMDEYRARGDELNEKILTYRCITDLYAMVTRTDISGDPTHVTEIAREYYLENAEKIQMDDPHFQLSLKYSCEEMGNPKYGVEDFRKWIETITA